MDKIVKGGHAVMLSVHPTEALRTAAVDWCLRSPDKRTPKIDDAHVTLLFLGRDMTEAQGAKILEAASGGERPLPTRSRTTGRLAIFGGKQDTLVALLEPENFVLKLRSELMQRLTQRGIKCRDNFGGWAPHVTLAIGEPNASNLEERLWPRKQEMPAGGLIVKLGSVLHSVTRK